MSLLEIIDCSIPGEWPANRVISAPRPPLTVTNIDDLPTARLVVSANHVLAALNSSWSTPFIVKDRLEDKVGFSVGSATVQRLLTELVADGSAEIRGRAFVGTYAHARTYRRVPNHGDALNALVAALNEKPRDVRTIRASETLNDRGDALPTSNAEMLRLLHALAEEGRIVRSRGMVGSRNWAFSRLPSTSGGAR